MNEADLVAVDQELAKRSFADFVQMAWPQIDAEEYQHNWHMDAISDHLMACHAGEMNRLLINVPPGTSKSSAASVFFPAWLWGPAASPHTRFIGAAHEQTLATRDNRRTRLLIESEWYQRRWPTQLVTDQNEKTNFENASGGFRQSSAVKGMTGKRGHYVVWDDPQNPEAADSDKSRETAIRVFKETLTSRLVNPRKSVIIIIMQRLNQEDVAGHILASDIGYEHLMLPMEFEPARRCYSVIKPSHFDAEPVEAKYDAIHQVWYQADATIPDTRKAALADKPMRTVYPQDPRTEEDELLFEARFPRDVVDRDKKAMGEYAAAGQFGQRPAPRSGGIFSVDQIEIIPVAPSGVRWVRAWDLAATEEQTAAYTAGALLGITPEGQYIIGDMRRGQLSSAKVEMLIKNTASQDGFQVKGSIPQDPGQSGKAQVVALISLLAGYEYRASPESGDKVSRAGPFAAQVEVGNVKMVAGDWNKDLLDEMRLFPASKFKDQVDALSRAFSELISAAPPAIFGTYG